MIVIFKAAEFFYQRSFKIKCRMCRIRANRRDYLAMRKNKVPMPLMASILKPVRKLPQYYKSYMYNFFERSKLEDAILPPISVTSK